MQSLICHFKHLFNEHKVSLQLPRCSAPDWRPTWPLPTFLKFCAPGAATTGACASSISSQTASCRISAFRALTYRALPGRTRSAKPPSLAYFALLPRNARLHGGRFAFGHSRPDQSPLYQSASGRTSGGSPLLRTQLSTAHFFPLLRSVSTAVECTQSNVMRET